MRPSRRFRPGRPDALEARVALSHGLGGAHVAAAAHRGAARPRARAGQAAPAAEINRQYDALTADVLAAARLYYAGVAAAPAPILPGPGAAVATGPAAQYQAYLAQRTQLMAQSLVNYFDGLNGAVKLPRAPRAYRVPRPPIAIQVYLSNRIAGPDPSSLAMTLPAIPPSADAGPGLDLYLAAVRAAIEGSRQEALGGVQLLFAGRDVLGLGLTAPTVPAT